MTFPRAVVLAIMISMMVRASSDPDEQIWTGISAILFGACLWHLTSDPLPAAIRKGLEDFAQRYRR